MATSENAHLRMPQKWKKKNEIPTVKAVPFTSKCVRSAALCTAEKKHQPGILPGSKMEARSYGKRHVLLRKEGLVLSSFSHEVYRCE